MISKYSVYICAAGFPAAAAAVSDPLSTIFLISSFRKMYYTFKIKFYKNDETISHIYFQKWHLVLRCMWIKRIYSKHNQQKIQKPRLKTLILFFFNNFFFKASDKSE